MHSDFSFNHRTVLIHSGLVFLNLLFLGTCVIIFSQVWGLSLGIFLFHFYFSVPYFGLACDHENSFLCLEEYEREGYWIEVRTAFNVKTRFCICSL